jgi:hypothetical protein
MSKRWTYSIDGGEAYLCLRVSGTVVNLTKTSNGWFRFVPFDGSRHRICWSGGSVDYQDFPQGSAGSLASLKSGGGVDVPESFIFGSWTITREDRVHVIRNKDTSSQSLHLTCLGFVFLTQAKHSVAVIVENGKEVIETLDIGRQVLLAASENAKPKVIFSPTQEFSLSYS